MARTESAEFAVRLCEAGYDWGPFMNGLLLADNVPNAVTVVDVVPNSNVS